MSSRFAIYSDYADGYCEDWTPTGTALFTSGSTLFAPSRQPVYPTFTLRWQQPVDMLSGGATIARAPWAQEMLVGLSWPGMSGADRGSLESFFATVKGMATPFTLYCPAIGPALPVGFATDSLGEMPQIAYDRYRVSLALRVDLRFPQVESPGTSSLVGTNCFSIGGVFFPFPVPLRPTTGYSVRRPQTLEFNSGGEPVVYSKSVLTLQQHRMVMALDYDGFVRLQAFFFGFVHGQHKKFTWIDSAGVKRKVRLAGSEITVRQTAYNRYETELSLVEEL